MRYNSFGEFLKASLMNRDGIIVWSEDGKDYSAEEMLALMNEPKNEIAARWRDAAFWYCKAERPNFEAECAHWEETDVTTLC